MIWGNLFKKKLNVFVFEPNINRFSKYRGKLEYNKGNKRWYLVFSSEKMPAPENILEYILGDNLFMVRKELNNYEIINLNTEALKYFDKNVKPEGVDITSAQIYDDLIKAELRRIRQGGFWTKYGALVAMLAVVLMTAIAFVILFNNITGPLEQISKNFASAMETLQNITNTQLEFLKNATALKPPEIPR